MKKVIVISGPTGIGKTSLAIRLAKEFDLTIINADASQMRKHMDIGTANIKDDEVKGLNYHLFKFLEPTSDFSIKDYQDIVRPIIDKTNLPLLVGGSGLYIDSALLDYDLSSDARDKSLETNESDEDLYERLKTVDPVLASKTHPHNRKRVLRYLEIAGKDAKKPVELYDCLYITLDMNRDLLYENINNRFDQMLQDGWVDEVKWLKSNNYDISKIKEIGYLEISEVIDGLISIDEASDKVKQATRNYAKRQLTWFRGSENRYANYHKFSPNEYDSIKELVKMFIQDIN